MKNLFKVFALVLGLGLGYSQGVLAATELPLSGSYTFNATDSMDFGNDIHGIKTPFNDVFGFDLSGESTFDASIIATFNAEAERFQNFSAVLYNVTTNTLVKDFFHLSAGQPVYSDNSFDNSISVTGLSNAHHYEIRVSGMTSENFDTSSYFGTVTVSPVPEVEEWVMMMIGIGFIGVQLRRKNQMQNASFSF